MKTFDALATLLATASSPVRAHWVYNQLIVNDAFVGEPYQYIRRPQDGNNFLSDVNSTDMRCNVGGFLWPSNKYGDGDSTRRRPARLRHRLNIRPTRASNKSTCPARRPPTTDPSSTSSSVSRYDGLRRLGTHLLPDHDTHVPPTAPARRAGKQTQLPPTRSRAPSTGAPHKLTNFTFPWPREETPAGEYLLARRGRGAACRA